MREELEQIEKAAQAIKRIPWGHDGDCGAEAEADNILAALHQIKAVQVPTYNWTEIKQAVEDWIRADLKLADIRPSRYSELKLRLGWNDLKDFPGESPSRSVEGGNGWISDEEIEKQALELVPEKRDPNHPTIDYGLARRECVIESMRHYRDHILKASPPVEPSTDR